MLLSAPQPANASSSLTEPLSRLQIALRRPTERISSWLSAAPTYCISSRYYDRFRISVVARTMRGGGHIKAQKRHQVADLDQELPVRRVRADSSSEERQPPNLRDLGLDVELRWLYHSTHMH